MKHGWIGIQEAAWLLPSLSSCFHKWVLFHAADSLCRRLLIVQTMLQVFCLVSLIQSEIQTQFTYPKCHALSYSSRHHFSLLYTLVSARRRLPPALSCTEAERTDLFILWLNRCVERVKSLQVKGTLTDGKGMGVRLSADITQLSGKMPKRSTLMCLVTFNGQWGKVKYSWGGESAPWRLCESTSGSSVYHPEEMLLQMCTINTC